MNEIVIVIDDEPGVRNTIGMILTHFGFRAASGASREDLTRLLDEHPDAAAVLCDQSLVQDTGLQIYRDLKDAFDARRIAFILFHGAEDAFAAEVRALGIRELRKPPAHISDIETAIREEIARVRQTP